MKKRVLRFDSEGTGYMVLSVAIVLREIRVLTEVDVNLGFSVLYEARVLNSTYVLRREGGYRNVFESVLSSVI